MTTATIHELGNRLHGMRDLVVFTGAGMSAESGVPTFRGNDGIWKKFSPGELASLNAFMKNPALVWEWYRARRTVITGTQPNAGHRALVRLEEKFSLTIVTQNIDNLHRRAGSNRVIELHGNIERNYCIRCCARYDDGDVPLSGGSPVCGRTDRGSPCGGLVRPDVVWFGEVLPEEEWTAAARAMQRADAVLSVGTSGVVYPAASLPQLAKESGALLVELNPEPTPLTPRADLFLRGQAGVLLPELAGVLGVSPLSATTGETL